MALYTGSLFIARNVVGQKQNPIQKMQPYYSASIKSESTIAEQKQRSNLTVHTLNSLHLSDILDSAHFRSNTQVAAQASEHKLDSSYFREGTQYSATF